MSWYARFRRSPTLLRSDPDGDRPPGDGDPEAADGDPGPAGGDPGGRRPVLAWAATVLAGLVVLLALVAPDEQGHLTPAAFLRIPVEGLVPVVLLLALPARARRVVAVVAGIVLGVLTVLKTVDVGFSAVLGRPFDLVLDWGLIGAATGVVEDSVGRAGAVATVAAAGLLVAAVLLATTLSVLRLTRLAVGHGTATTRTVGVLTVVWIACAALGVELVPGVPVASAADASLVGNRALQIRTGLRDRQAFAAEAAVDPFRNTPGAELLTGLRGKDVIVSFVESYGRYAVEDPTFSPRITAVLDAGTRRLDAAGFGSRSAFLTSSTVGGGSWLAHGTLLSGLWINSQQRYRSLVSSDRLTLPSGFRRAGWNTVSVEPAVDRAWPEARFFGYGKVYDSRNLGYRGPRFSYATMPDQYTLATFQRAERAPGHAPVMAEITLVSSHTPWTPIPRLLDWDALGDGSVFQDPANRQGGPPGPILGSPGRLRASYAASVEYSLATLISYVEHYGGDDLVLVFLGDHQPAPVLTGAGASRDVPVTIVARDPAVLDRISGWGWQPGLRPGPQAPVWRMDSFRDRLLTALGAARDRDPATPPADGADPVNHPDDGHRR